MNKAVFLDRDGTINIEKDYVYKIEDFEFIDGVVEALRMLRSLGYKLIVVTNQSGIARGYYSEKDFFRLNDWMKNTLSNQGVKIDAVYYCPHHPNAKIEKYKINCKCRKPQLALYEKAASDFDIDFSKSIAIGDKIRDCSICNVYHCKGILIGTNEDKNIIEAVKSGYVENVSYEDTLFDAAKFILNESKR